MVIAETFREGRSEVATTPPIEWPMTMMDVSVRYNESMYDIAVDA